MRLVNYIIMISSLWASCQGPAAQHGQTIRGIQEKERIDTLSALSLKNRQSDLLNYSIVLVGLPEMDKLGYEIKKIVVSSNGKMLTSIPLPNPEDVKNFDVSEIMQTETGFKIAVDWGGGNNFYGREFYFTFRNKEVYLDSLQMNSYMHDTENERKSIKLIKPPMPINEFDILNYLENE